MQRINLSHCCLDEAEMTNAHLTHCNFSGASIVDGILQHTNLADCVFSGAVIRSTRMEGAQLRRADFSNADLHGTCLRGARLEGAQLFNADLTSTDLRDACDLHKTVGIPKCADGLRIYHSQMECLRKTPFGRWLNEQGDAISAEREYDVAISFAGEDRGHAEAISELLRRKSVKVFYDEYKRADLWGKDLYEHLSFIYQKCAKFCVMLISQHYVEKNWTILERRAAQARAFEMRTEYILPIRLDDAEVPGILSTTGYIDLRNTDITHIARMIREKLAATGE